jgi:hypothetical protein
VSRATSSGQAYLDSFDPRTLPPGTTLRDVARYYYGSYALWTLVARASGVSYPPDADLTKMPGDPPTRIVVPRRTSR